MKTTGLSSKGRDHIPKVTRQAYKRPVGQLLRPQDPFPQTCVDDVSGCLQYKGRSKTVEDMNNAIRQGIYESLWNRR